MEKTDRVIVLRKVKYSESDLILNCLNAEGARVNFLAKAALRSKKRFGGGVLEPTHYINVTYKYKEGREIHFLQEASLIEGFVGLRQDYDRLELALHFLGLMAKVSFEGGLDSEKNFNLLGNALKQTQTSKDLNLLKTLFELKFLYYQGVMPPDLSIKNFLDKPLSEHEQISVTPQDLKHLKGRIHTSINNLFS